MDEEIKDERPLPLSGVRVLDLGHVFQGPYGGFLLAMAGAEIIKIEPPRGDMSRKRGRDGDYPFRAPNGSKRGVVLNLKEARGRELLIDFARHADVLMENFAPAVMPRPDLHANEALRTLPERIRRIDEVTDWIAGWMAPPPDLGEHTDAVLGELCGMNETTLAELRRDGVIGG